MITEEFKKWIDDGGNAACAIDNNPQIVAGLEEALRFANKIGAAMKEPIQFKYTIVDNKVTVSYADTKSGVINGVGVHCHSPISGDNCVTAVKALMFDMLEEAVRPVHRATIIIPAATAQHIKSLLTYEPADESECMGEDETISYTAKFDDGKQVDVKVCGVQFDEENPTNTPWTEAVLFDENSSELCCTDPDATFFGTWEIDYDEEVYLVTVIAEKPSIEFRDFSKYEPTDVSITVEWYDDDGELVKRTATAAEWFSDWYGECNLCPANDTAINKVVAVSGDQKVLKVVFKKHAPEDKPMFEELMEAIRPSIVFHHWGSDREEYVACLETSSTGEPRYFIGHGAALWFIEKHDVPYAKVVECCGICNNCGQPVFPAREVGVWGTCFHCDSCYAGPDDLLKI